MPSFRGTQHRARVALWLAAGAGLIFGAMARSFEPALASASRQGRAQIEGDYAIAMRASEMFGGSSQS